MKYGEFNAISRHIVVPATIKTDMIVELSQPGPLADAR